MLRVPESQGMALGKAIQKLVTDIKYCQNVIFSDEDICEICSNHMRNDEVLCIVEDLRDIMAIENTAKFNGKYLVLVVKFLRWKELGHQLNISSLKEN